MLRHKPKNVPPPTDNDLSIKREPACEFRPELGWADGPTNNERARCANVDSIEALQLFGEDGWSKGLVTADVDSSQKNDERHVSPQ